MLAIRLAQLIMAIMMVLSPALLFTHHYLTALICAAGMVLMPFVIWALDKWWLPPGVPHG